MTCGSQEEPPVSRVTLAAMRVSELPNGRLRLGMRLENPWEPDYAQTACANIPEVAQVMGAWLDRVIR